MQRKIIVITTSLVLLTALSFIWRRVNPSLPVYNHGPMVGLGQVLADETAEAVHDHGRVVVVVAKVPGATAPVLPANGTWEGFNDELKKHDAIKLMAIEAVAVATAGPPACSTSEFKRICEQYAGADAIVFFLGLPGWYEVDTMITPHPTPKLLVVNTGWMPSKNRYSGYFDKGMLTAVIGARLAPVPATTGNPNSPREQFQTIFQVYTSENYESLPD